MDSSFEFQKWPVYRGAIELTKDCFTLASKLPIENRTTVDQLRRASQSIALNIAEGSARYSRADKINFFRVARGSVFECAAIVDVLEILNVRVESDFPSLRQKLVLVGKMLSGLIKFVGDQKPPTSAKKVPNP